MTRALIAIGLLLLFTIAAANEDQLPDDVLQLAYNPTYDLWYFNPRGRPDKVTDNIKNAYNERRPGGVCYLPDDIWFYCRTGEKISE
ncbi:uncharacterized protein LOC115763677 [Drosophila novamexicana]|uniref:uncharacterized protein LOC115763677 n=1 Tax=Drosophila novamexicana TaxID=47314 RepID=UPI0011E5C259|nr:uncharacterized protein LOC115763677 [Drosophila novamexicana]